MDGEWKPKPYHEKPITDIVAALVLTEDESLPEAVTEALKRYWTTGACPEDEQVHAARLLKLSGLIVAHSEELSRE